MRRKVANLSISKLGNRGKKKMKKKPSNARTVVTHFLCIATHASESTTLLGMSWSW
jgi:hypothetical protein